MPSLDGITYIELTPDGDIGSYARDSVSLRRVFDVDWADKDAFMRAMLGGTTEIGGKTIRVLPQEYESGSAYVATTASFRGLGPPTKVNNRLAFAQARITINYGLIESRYTWGESEEEDEPDEAWGDERVESHVEFLQIPGYKLKFTSDNKQLEEPSALPYSLGTLVLTRYNVSSVKESTYRAKKGHINSASYRGYAAGTLMFMGWNAARTINVYDQRPKYTVTVMLGIKETGWKNVLRWDKSGSTPQYEEVKTVGGAPLFNETSFSGII
jgi:hypothetical protein